MSASHAFARTPADILCCVYTESDAAFTQSAHVCPRSTQSVLRLDSRESGAPVLAYAPVLYAAPARPLITHRSCLGPHESAHTHALQRLAHIESGAP
eukprot:5549420-Alexandrium_andersonii.AAC.1